MLKKLSLRGNPVVVLDHLDLDIPKVEFLTITGKNGSVIQGLLPHVFP
jgi:ABC-type Mn2+/Zn2+ transport system ATPase subunit